MSEISTSGLQLYEDTDITTKKGPGILHLHKNQSLNITILAMKLQV